MTRNDTLTRFADWLDDRLGYRIAQRAVRRHLRPTGPRWSLAASVSTFGMFLVVLFTGIILMTGYSPASDHGWSSVFHIESTPGGSFLRGLHYYGSHALIVLFALHMARTIWTASYQAPRDLAWIVGVLLLPFLAAAAVTGNPLSASNKAVGQIEVEGHIVGNMPLIGPMMHGLLIGGEHVGHLTMTRLYSLHVVVLPLLAGTLLILHIYQQIRWADADHSEADPDPNEPPTTSGQAGRNALVFGVMFGIVAYLAWKYGAPLDAPADPTLPSMPRPEWYFRSLFELRNTMTGAGEFVVTGLFPLLFLALLLALPWIDRLMPEAVARWFRYVLVVGAAIGWVGLTFQSYAKDRKDPVYQEYLAESQRLSDRAWELATANAIPPAGPGALLQNDPKTQGPLLFERHCASCHSHVDSEGKGITAQTEAASNLYGFGSRDWIAGLLDPERISQGDYYGHTAFVTEGMSMGMIDYVENQLYEVDEAELPERKKQVEQVVKALSAEARLPSQIAQDQRDAADISAGRQLLAGADLGCVDCHKYGQAGELGMAPDLTGYASRGWLRDFVANPAHERFYPDTNDNMPAYFPAAPGAAENILTRRELMLIVDWLRGDWVGAVPASQLAEVHARAIAAAAAEDAAAEAMSEGAVAEALKEEASADAPVEQEADANE